MKPALKTILAAGMLLFLGFHFSMVLNDTAHIKAGGIVKAVSSQYCYPYFEQQWAVFVPAPDVAYDVYMRAGKDGHWQPWFNPGEELVCWNRQRPALGAEPEMLLVSSALYYMDNALDDHKHIYSERPEWPAFKVLDHAARGYFHHSVRSHKEKEYELILTKTRHGKTEAWYFKNLSF